MGEPDAGGRWPRTRLTELLGVRHPILLAPMAGAVTPALAAGVTAAGGLGAIPAGTASDDAVEEALGAARAIVPGPYNVNSFLHPPPSPPPPDQVARALRSLAPLYADAGLDPPAAAADPLPHFDASRLERLLAMRPEVASFHFGLPADDALAALREAGVVLIASATTVAEAEELVARGVDAVIAQGAEAGGHRGGEGLIGTMALVPQVVDAVPVPVIAAGGIADGRGVAAALALGAEGVQLGTALLRCAETAYDEDQRRRLARARGEDTVLTRGVSGRPARGLRTALTGSEEVAADALEYPLQISLTSRLAAAPDVKPTWSGQAVGLARADDARAIVARIVAETFAAIDALAGPGEDGGAVEV